MTRGNLKHTQPTSERRRSRRRFLVFLGAAGMLGACRNTDDDASERGAKSAADLAASSDAGRRAPLELAWQRALAGGKPLVVILVPPANAWPARRDAQLFGAILWHGDDATMTALASVELACATADDCSALVGSRCEPLALFAIIDAPHGGAPRARALRMPLVPPMDWPRNTREEADAEVHKRIEKLSTAVREAIAPSGVVADAAVAASTRARYRARAPAGSRWAYSFGCGYIEIEGEADAERAGTYCGVGHVPEVSQRFLWYYEKPWTKGMHVETELDPTR